MPSISTKTIIQPSTPTANAPLNQMRVVTRRSMATTLDVRARAVT
jgi:hypothetical protein